MSFKKIITVFSLILLICSNLSFSTLAQNNLDSNQNVKLFNSNLDYSIPYFNSTLGVFADVKTIPKNQKIEINYTIIESLYGESRQGIFLSLPKNQDGIWTNYKVLKVEKSNPKNYNDDFLNFAKENNLDFENFKPESYKKILEYDQLRLRIGTAGTHLPKGVYQYNIKIEANYQPNLNYEFEFAKDWTGEIKETALRFDGEFICSSVDNQNCLKNGIRYNLNPNKPTFNGILATFGFMAGTWVLTPLIATIGSYLFPTAFFYLIILILYFLFAKDPSFGHVHDKPEYEPPKDLLPWQAEYLIKEGGINLKDTFLSYLLYLNHKKIIEFKTNLSQKEGEKSKLEDEMKLEIKQTIPYLDGLPSNKFKNTLQKIAKYGPKKGFKEALLSKEDEATLNYTIQKSLNYIYKITPFNNDWTVIWSIFFVVLFLIIFLFAIIQEPFLFGNSISTLILISWVLTLPGLIFLTRRWGILNKEQYNKRAYCLRYKYYLENVEKEKLDFSNNPQEGLQYYLKNVPYAAGFGLLNKFNKYMKKIMPVENQQYINSSSLYSTRLLTSSLYIPPSTSSGGVFSGGGSFSSGGFSGGGGSW